ncbi:hypothetical protein [Budvicia diplopodorum]|uniref:hypothetical protein n=1 Tax=Budvicia diplopodorum TaxID=1119056 RepID=UPI00135B7354|nr:hypothetical protein [Budvicia diplopodorum]
MKGRLVVLIFAIFIASNAQAKIKDISFSVGDETVFIPADCVVEVSKVESELVGREGVFFRLNQGCADQLSTFTKMKIGKTVVLRYNDHVVGQVTIASRISSSFRIDSSGVEPMMIRQILVDAEAK